MISKNYYAADLLFIRKINVFVIGLGQKKNNLLNAIFAEKVSFLSPVMWCAQKCFNQKFTSVLQQPVNYLGKSWSRKMYSGPISFDWPISDPIHDHIFFVDWISEIKHQIVLLFPPDTFPP